MNEKQIIVSAKLFIESLFKGDYSGHDAEHSVRYRLQKQNNTAIILAFLN